MDEKRINPYQKAADTLIAQLEAGTVPWRKPWASVGMPKNLISKKEYRGMNVLVLLLENRPSPYWLTVPQANKLGGHVMKGEKGTAICKYSVYDRKSRNEETGEEASSRRGFMKAYTVFNIAQCNPELAEGLGLNKPAAPIEDLPAAQAVWDNFPNKPTLRDADKAFYRPSDDSIGMPVRGAFKEQREYYFTLFHEMVHSTGATKRLNREKSSGNRFGDADYSVEELVAEFGASMLCSVVGIQPEVVANSASYIQNWLEVLKASDNKKMLTQAVSAAQKACDHIRAVKYERADTPQETEAISVVVEHGNKALIAA
jgi:antirestriction protein ArdC